MKKNSPLLTIPQCKQATSAPDSPVKKIHLREYYTRSKSCFPSCVLLSFSDFQPTHSPLPPSFLLFLFVSSFFFPLLCAIRDALTIPSGVGWKLDGQRVWCGYTRASIPFSAKFSVRSAIQSLPQILLRSSVFPSPFSLLAFFSFQSASPDPLYSRLSVAIYSRDYVLDRERSTN